MKNKRFFFALAAAFFSTLLALYAGNMYLAKQVNDRFSRQVAQQEMEVVVASADILIGSRIEEKQVALAKYPKRLLPDKAILKREDVIGRVAVADIVARTPILERHLASPGAQPGLQGVTSAGMRAVSVRVDEASSVGGFVTSGAYVDVIAIMQPQIDGARQVSKVILQKVRVLAGGQQLQNKTDGKPALVNTVTLEVTPNQAEKLKLAEAEGRLQLSIRNAMDQTIENTTGATRRDVISDLALEQRAAEGTTNAGNDARPVQTRASRNANAGPQNPAAQNSPEPKATPRAPAIELIEGAKRTRVEVIP